MKRTVMITGAARRLGAGIARLLALEGWEIIIHYNHSREEALKLSDDLQKKYPDRQFPVIQCDLTNQDAVLSVFSRLPDAVRQVDAMVNNASTFNPGKIVDTSPVFLRKEMAVNFEAPFFLLQAFVNTFGKGAVVNMLDAKVVKNEGGHAAYLLAKKSLAELTRMAAFDFAPDIRVNGVAPGPVLPPPRKGDDYLKEVIEQTPLKKRVTVEDIAASVSFLLNNPSVTGQILFCDSGSHLV
jgi:pteridine reductase